MEKIEFTASFQIAEKDVTEIKVNPLTFLELGQLWDQIGVGSAKAEVALQRARIKHQAHFMNGSERLIPSPEDLHKMPFPVAKAIIDALGHGQGLPGKVIGNGDGATAPILYKLGTPIEMKDGTGKARVIEELEFMASTYGELEDVFAAENEVARALALLTAIAVPVGVDGLTRLPGWAIDRITVADGVTIMKQVSNRF